MPIDDGFFDRGESERFERDMQYKRYQYLRDKNKKLIEINTKLLEALEELVELEMYSNEIYEDEYNSAFVKARQAIAKARGNDVH